MSRLAWVLAVGTAAAGTPAWASEQPGWSLLSRNYFLHSDTRSASTRRSYRQEWAQGFISESHSPFTPGPFGLGVDAQGSEGLLPFHARSRRRPFCREARAAAAPGGLAAFPTSVWGTQMRSLAG
ncbi:OprD family outer membrane porin [Pseudomonas argentinensis]|uniref:OprD family outer membrane porin n=1 Tax=Phytopseudomonas argentinensis TaxID=289370 RepID=UPI0009F5C3D4